MHCMRLNWQCAGCSGAAGQGVWHVLLFDCPGYHCCPAGFSKRPHLKFNRKKRKTNRRKEKHAASRAFTIILILVSPFSFECCTVDKRRVNGVLK